jgi:hypothetical protein
MILKYYSEDSYAQMRGSLGSSCKEWPLSRIFELYCENQDKVVSLSYVEAVGDC